MGNQRDPTDNEDYDGDDESAQEVGFSTTVEESNDVKYDGVNAVPEIVEKSNDVEYDGVKAVPEIVEESNDDGYDGSDENERRMGSLDGRALVCGRRVVRT